MDRTFSDLEVRVWYDHKDKGIGALIDTSKPIKEQAIQACNLRNMYRTQAREMMKNQVKRRNLDVTDPNKTFEELLERKKLKYGLEGEEAYKAIVASSMKANPKVNKMFGLE
ncbi:Uncharacterised protein [Peptostreptococcus anaerobius]|uniref:Uncharacterized protein n=1 Tax=Peptostreptococcus anaerobius TaxID=1261 RepID=A0A379CDU2_9FIRM|nr:hypothetical protein [Peptostreptococcus anaerobius]EKX91853.1 hypothetical protein HMPREF9998_01277 [Peptostreptococcus anaerobius VPI 4330 = DSM 2949]SFM96019.1 filamentous hemagglutinin [Peptostreptococcus anaerobius]SUB60440.1 Uncharacterised protein [Peptostreptococcus anaerobius]